MLSLPNAPDMRAVEQKRFLSTTARLWNLYPSFFADQDMHTYFSTFLGKYKRHLHFVWCFWRMKWEI